MTYCFLAIDIVTISNLIVLVLGLNVSMNDKNQEKKEVLYFYCESSLKTEFYKLSQEKNVSPSSLLRAFMRRTVKTWEEEKQKQLEDAEKDKK